MPTSVNDGLADIVWTTPMTDAGRVIALSVTEPGAEVRYGYLTPYRARELADTLTWLADRVEKEG